MYKFQFGNKTIEFSQEELYEWSRKMSIPISELTLRDVADFCATRVFGLNHRFFVNVRETNKHINNWVEDKLLGQVAQYGPNCHAKRVVHRDQYTKFVTQTIEVKQLHER